MNPMVSIIVPVYNAEKTLCRCVDSVLDQEYRDFELLLVNDGSKDQSGNICREYAEKESRVRVINKPNTGVSDSRNIAVSMARGTYLQFLDSDDWITPNATRLFVEAAEKYHCDMVISDFYRVSGNRVSPKGDIDEDCVLTLEEFAAHMIENPADFYYGVLWNKLYRRDIIENNRLRMNTEISWCEDFLFNLEYMRHCNVFFALKVPVYYYVKTKGSLASQGGNISRAIKMKLMVFDYYNSFYKHVLTEEDYEKSQLQVRRFLIEAARDGAVGPAILPGAKKLGEERSRVVNATLSGEGIQNEQYRSRKLLDYYLEPPALKNGLSLEEIRLIFDLAQPHCSTTLKELADFTQMTPRHLSSLLQKLSRKSFLKTESRRDGSRLTITFLPAGEILLEDLAQVQTNYEKACFDGFTEDELIQYGYLSDKIKQNILKKL